MGRKRREIPWLEWRENGVAYVHWYDAQAGYTRKRSLGTSDPDEAQRAYAEFLIGGGAAIDSRSRHGLTVAQVLDAYTRQKIDATDDRGRPIMADGARQKIAIANLVAYFGDRPMSDIGPKESQGYKLARREGRVGPKQRKVGDATIRRELNCLIAAFNHCVKWELIDGVCRVELPIVEHDEKVKWFTKDEIGYILDTTTGKLHDFTLLAYYTAARRRSIENLTAFQVSLRDGTIDLMPPDARATKKRKPMVPIYPEIRPTIERLMAESTDGFLFSGHRGVYRTFVEHLADIGLKGHPHMLRHSRASHMLMDGEPIYKVARLLGDTVSTTERVYGHISPDFLSTQSRIRD